MKQKSSVAFGLSKVFQLKMVCCVSILLFSALYITLALGTKSTVCPESKKLYPGDCRLFYKCVPLYGSTLAPASVWIPTRCTAGMVFHPIMKTCVVSTENINCYQEFYGNKETTTKRYKISVLKPIHNSGTILNALEQNSVPLSAVNNPPMDSIEKQMLQLKQLISTFHSTTVQPTTKEVSYHDHNAQKPQPQGSSLLQGVLTKPSKEKDSLPIQLSEITEQLMLPTPTLQTNFNTFQTNGNKYEKQNFTQHPFTSYIPVNINTKHTINKYSKINLHTHQAKPNINLSIFKENKPQHSYNKDPYEDTIKLDEDYYSDDQFESNIDKTNKINCVIGTRFPNLSNCRKYHICGASDKYTFYDFTCPSNMAFNKLKRICDVGEYKQCIKADIKQEKTTYKEERSF